VHVTSVAVDKTWWCVCLVAQPAGSEHPAQGGQRLDPRARLTQRRRCAGVGVLLSPTGAVLTDIQRKAMAHKLARSQEKMRTVRAAHARNMCSYSAGSQGSHGATILSLFVLCGL
jgi:hypothetical protein